MFLLICCQGKVTTTLVAKRCEVILFNEKTNLQIQGHRRMRGRRGGKDQDHPVVIINWNFQCLLWIHSGGLGMDQDRNTKLT